MWLTESKVERSKLKQLLLCLVLFGLLLSTQACGEAVPAKATSPAEVVDRVEVGMTSTEAMEQIDQEYFVQNHAFAVVNFSKLEVVGDAIKYEATKELDSPYYAWLFFGVVVKDLNPALVGLEAEGDTVVVVSRIAFDEAQRLIEWQSGRPFRR